MNHGSLFSGIGGFDLAAEWMGWNNVFHCEWNEFGKKILKYYWPNAISYDDITKSDFTIHRGTIDILTGGFPCQPYSAAGKRKGKEDARHLWPEMLRAIREIQPTWVVGENVFGITNWNGGLVLNEVQTDLEAEGYEVQPFILPACAVNAPHRRDRVWFIAHSKNNGFSREFKFRENNNISERSLYEYKKIGRDEVWPVTERLIKNGNVTDAENERLEGKNGSKQARNIITRSIGFEGFPTQSPIYGRNDGISPELVGITISKHRNESIKAYGNAIVPQVAYQIFKSINHLPPCT